MKEKICRDEARCCHEMRWSACHSRTLTWTKFTTPHTMRIEASGLLHVLSIFDPATPICAMPRTTFMANSTFNLQRWM